MKQRGVRYILLKNLKHKMINKTWIEFIRFCIVGTTTFVIDYGLLIYLTEILKIDYFISSGISFSVAVIINYILCILFVFTQYKNGYKQFSLFVLSSIVGLFLNQFCMWFFVELCYWHYLLAKVLATVVVTLWNYITKKKSLALKS